MARVKHFKGQQVRPHLNIRRPGSMIDGLPQFWGEDGFHEDPEMLAFDAGEIAGPFMSADRRLSGLVFDVRPITAPEPRTPPTMGFKPAWVQMFVVGCERVNSSGPGFSLCESLAYAIDYLNSQWRLVQKIEAAQERDRYRA